MVWAGRSWGDGGAGAIVLGVAAGVAIACGGGPSPEVIARIPPAPVALPSCAKVEPPVVEGFTPSLRASLAATPDWFDIAAGPDPEVSVRIGKDDIPVPQGLMEGAETWFERATPYIPTAGEAPLLVFKVRGDAGRALGGTVSRRAIIDVRFGDEVVTLRPNEGGHFYFYASAPGVRLVKGDTIGVTVRGQGLVDIRERAAAEGPWDGTWPFAVGDDSGGLEVRAIASVDLERRIRLAGEAVDSGLIDGCGQALVFRDQVPSWHAVGATVEERMEQFGSFNGWNDPRVQARFDRVDRIDAEWRAEVRKLVSEVDTVAPPLTTPSTVDKLTLTVVDPTSCEPHRGDRGWEDCSVSFATSGQLSPDLEHALEDAVMHGSGYTWWTDVTVSDAGIELTWTAKVPLAEGEKVFYRPDGAAEWIRLR